jgi:NitT/TauT family transport system ATP-binding protein
LTDFHPISKVTLGQILGLIEAVDEVGGAADAATISQEVDMDIDRLGPILDAGELLGLVTVEEGDVRITEVGRKLLHANVQERKRIIRDIIDDVPLFRLVMDMARASGRPLSREEILETLSARVGSHQAHDLFKALVYWGRYVELLRYESQSELLSLRTPSK